MKKTKTAFSKSLVFLLVILTSFSFLAAHAQEDFLAVGNEFVEALPVVENKVVELSLEPESIEPQLAICDHNGDGVRNLSDVSMFATIKDTLNLSEIAEYAEHNQDDIWCAAQFRRLPVCDHNGDTLRNLSDVALFAAIKDTLNLSEIADYTANNQDDNWCAINYGPSASESAQDTQLMGTNDSSASTTVGLAICDHNGDGERNLSDVSLFAACQNTFDADGNGIHDLNDISLYTTNHQDNYFCANNFVCQAQASSTEPSLETVVSGGSSLSSALEICDHNNDGYRNLVDVAFFANCKNTFDADGNGIHDLNDISLYTANNQDNDFCTNNFICQAQASSAPVQVLGEKLNNCNIDTDVTGQTQWADGSLIRGCDMKVYRIENQSKRHIVSLPDLFKYIGQRIYNVADEIVALF